MRLQDVIYEALHAFGKLLWGLAVVAFLFGGELLNSFLPKPFLPGPILDVVLAGAFGLLGLLVNILADQIEPVEDEIEEGDDKSTIE